MADTMTATMANNNEVETDVIICGCGPTGAMLSVLLSQYSVSHVILEKEPEITVDPRGIALDEDGIRCLQACGIYEKVFRDIGQCMGKFLFVGGSRKDLNARAFMEMNYDTTEGGTGHPGFVLHKQPSIEKHLRSRMEELGMRDIRLGCRVMSIKEDDEWVHARYVEDRGLERSVRGRFLVGADGKTGFTRKQYLEPRGIHLEQALRMPYQEDWVAMNWRISIPTPETHPDFPLWTEGYTPQQVYDAFFPTKFRFICDPERAAVCGRFGLDQDRLWRFEFVVLQGESPLEMSTPSKMAEVVYPYITHPGKRYGLSITELRYPPDCIEVLRCRPFRFSARSCNKWSLDRVILCGDAAHVFPPFGGQGIASGFRDAIALAWRLWLATKHSTSVSSQSQGIDHRKLLEGWYSERKQQLDESLASTIENGAYVTESNRLKILLRDWNLWFMQLIPSWRHWLQLGNRRDGMTQYRWQDNQGMAFMRNFHGGACFPQVYATRISGEGKVMFTDDIIFAPVKCGTFQLVAIVACAAEIEGLESASQDIERAGNGLLLLSEATVFAVNSNGDQQPHQAWQTYRFASGEEFAMDPVLCAGRPKPSGYDPHQMLKVASGNKFIVLRPDRFIFAACQTSNELLQIAHQLGRLSATGSLE